MAALSRVMEENLGGIRVVRAFSAGLHELSKFDAKSRHALDLAHRRVKMRVANTSAMNFSFFAAMALVLWFGGNTVIAADISVGIPSTSPAFGTTRQFHVR